MCRALTYPNLMAGSRMPHVDFIHTPPRNIEVAVAGGGAGGAERTSWWTSPYYGDDARSTSEYRTKLQYYMY